MRSRLRRDTAPRADPRCSPSSHETLGRGQRLHTRVWPLDARTLRRNGSYRPRGGFHHHPPVCDAPARFAPPRGAGGLVGTPKCPSGGGIQPARRVPAAMAPEAAGTQRAHRRRETRAGAARTARVTAARGAAGSRSRESRSAASPRPLAGRDEQATSGRAPAWQYIAVTQWQRRGRPLNARGARKKRKRKWGEAPRKAGGEPPAPSSRATKERKGKRGRAPGEGGPLSFAGEEPPLAGKPQTRAPTGRIVCVAGARQAAGRGGEDGGREHS
jgi:hypothetical protein